MRLSSVTHSLDTDQRLVPLDFRQEGNGALDARVPNDPGAAPPGWYMPSAPAAGVPSEACLIQVVPPNGSS